MSLGWLTPGPKETRSPSCTWGWRALSPAGAAAPGVATAAGGTFAVAVAADGPGTAARSAAAGLCTAGTVGGGAEVIAAGWGGGGSGRVELLASTARSAEVRPEAEEVARSARTPSPPVFLLSS